MSQSQAVVVTTHASRYLQQLCKHWSHRFTVQFDPANGEIDFGDDKSVSLRASPQDLTVVVTAKNSDEIPQLETVVADHLNRFGFREELVFDWSRQV